MKIEYKAPIASDYVDLRLRSGMGNKDIVRSQAALDGSLFTVSIYDIKKLIAFGRVVGDGGITYVISDIMVDREYQRQGYGDKIMQSINHYLDKNTFEDSFVCLIANSPADKLYYKYKFQYLPDNKCGMLRKQID